MGYEIEIYLDKRQQKFNIDYEIIKNAEKNNCERYHTDYEVAGIRHTIHKNNFIMTFVFPDDEIHIIRFIQFIKKKPKVHIDTISYNNCIFRIIYPKRRVKNEIKKISDQRILNALR
jgi:hypothetical protein